MQFHIYLFLTLIYLFLIINHFLIKRIVTFKLKIKNKDLYKQAGACDVYISKSETTDPVHVHSYNAGDSFGELALLYECPRAATVKVSLN